LERYLDVDGDVYEMLVAKGEQIGSTPEEIAEVTLSGLTASGFMKWRGTLRKYVEDL